MDEDVLSKLANIPKKKYLRKLIEVSICLNNRHNISEKLFQNPITENIQNDLQISKEEMHRLLVALSNMIQVIYRHHFDIQNLNLFSSEFDQELSKVILESILSLKERIEESREENMKEGNQLIDVNWKLDMQVGSEKGKKKNEPILVMEIESGRDGMMESQKLAMKGEEFIAFYNNFKKIKEQLSKLVEN